MDITAIVNAAIALLAAIITAVVIPWLRSRTTAAQRENIETWVQIAVAAAEQIFKGSGRGAEKKQYVEAFLFDKGLKIDGESMDAMIEAAVAKINAAWKG